LTGEDPLSVTNSKIASGKAKVGIIGLGYVGLPLALAIAGKFEVIGYDADAEKMGALREGISHIDDVEDLALKRALDGKMRIAEGESDLREADCIIICVPTPLDHRGNPDLSYIRAASDIVARLVRPGMVIILESTSYPGTTEEYLGHAIESRGYIPGRDVALAFSPERIDPGNRKFNIHNTPKIVGGVDERSTDMAAELYSKFIKAEVIKTNNCITAEAVKLVENIFRGVNIALINELALVFERMGIDTWEVIRSASTKPFGFMPHYPGPGVGGHCIPLDPKYLSYKAKQYGVIPRFIELSREVNEFMKQHTVNLTLEVLKDAGLNPSTSTVGIMGLAYKKNISDTRESPAKEIIEELSKKVKAILVHDPHAGFIDTSRGRFESTPFESILENSDCLVFLTDHNEFKKISLTDMNKAGVKAIVDTRNILCKKDVLEMGIIYRCIGK